MINEQPTTEDLGVVQMPDGTWEWKKRIVAINRHPCHISEKLTEEEREARWVRHKRRVHQLKDDGYDVEVGSFLQTRVLQFQCLC